MENLWQQIQEQIIQSAQNFHTDALGRLKGQLRGDRAQLEDLAGQLPQGDARARIQGMLDSYSEIEGTLDRAAHELGVEDAVNAATRRTPEAGEQDVQGARDDAGGVISQTTDAVGQVAGQAGQIAGAAQEAIGQAVEQVGELTEKLPGGLLLNRTTNEAGQTMQRVVDKSGNILDITLDAASDLVDEKVVGSLTTLQAEAEFQNEKGETNRIVRDESGTLIELQFDEDGNILGLSIPPSAEGTTG